MRIVYRWLRRGMSATFGISAVVGAIYFGYGATLGIVDEVEFRRTQTERDGYRRQTATAAAPTIGSESIALVAYREETVELSTDTPPPLMMEASPTPTTSTNHTQTSTVIPPTETPSPGATTEPLLQDATAFPTNTIPPTALSTNTPFPSNTPLPTDTATPTNTPTPTVTFTPSVTPTATNTPRPTLVIEGTYTTPVSTPITTIQMRAPLVEDDPNIINIALLGSDVGSTLARNDVTIVVSINRNTGTAAMWHIPRDLLVYIPGYTIDRINRTFQIGQQDGWPGGGPALLKEMFLYNFGLEIDFYARVDFNDFKAIIAELGDLTISVDCEITDWRQIDPEVSIEEARTSIDYWEEYTLTVGVHELNPYMALWYARSRVTTNDLDRGRRQMDLLRAMWAQAKENGLFDQVLNLWPRTLEIVDTDMQLDDIVELVPLALTIELGDIERYSMRQGVHMETWLTPDDGRSVFLPNWSAIHALAQEFVTPPNQNRLSRANTLIEVHDGTLYGLGWGQVAVDRLAWEGFSPVLTEVLRTRNDVTVLYDFTGETKGSELQRIQEILRISDANVIIQPDPNRSYDYRVVVGRSYNSCIYGSSADEVELPAVPPEVSGEQ